MSQREIKRTSDEWEIRSFGVTPGVLSGHLGRDGHGDKVLSSSIGGDLACVRSAEILLDLLKGVRWYDAYPAPSPLTWWSVIWMEPSGAAVGRPAVDAAEETTSVSCCRV